MMKFRDPKTGKVFNTIEGAVSNFRCPGPCADCPLVEKVRGINGCVSGKWWKDHPVEAAQRMGYEVIDDKEDNMDKQDKQIGLRLKYDVTKVETGEKINNCFVLRPDRDPAAVTALRAYARVTPNKALADDIIAWVGAEPADKPRLAEVLEVEVGERFAFRDGEKELPGLYITKEGIMCDSSRASVFGNVVCACINHPESIIRLPRLTEPEITIMRDCGATWVSQDVNGTTFDLWESKPFLTENGYEGSNLAATVFGQRFPSVKPGDCIELEKAGGGA